MTETAGFPHYLCQFLVVFRSHSASGKGEAFLQKTEGLFLQAAASVFVAEKRRRLILFMQQTAKMVSDFRYQKIVMIPFFQHRKCRIQVAFHRVAPQETAAQAVYRSDLGMDQVFQLSLPVDPLRLFLTIIADYFYFVPYPVAHFSGSLPGKSYGQDLPGQHRVCRLPEPQTEDVQKALYQHPCFTAAGACRHRHIGIDAVNRPVLRRC